MKKLAITLMFILGVGISIDANAQFKDLANAQFKDLKNLVGGGDDLPQDRLDPRRGGAVQDGRSRADHRRVAGRPARL